MNGKRSHSAQSVIHILESRRKRKLKKRTSLLSRSRQVLIIIGAAVLAVLALLAVTAGLYARMLSEGLPSAEEAARRITPAGEKALPATQFYDRSGETLLYTLENAGVQRRYLSVDPAVTPHFSRQLVKAVLSLDDDFWSGPGISLRQAADPAPHTLAERLVLDWVLYDEPAGLPRAVRMRLLAVVLQIRYGKARMLEWYLNTAYFGSRAYGADQAARIYLGKSAETLNLAESALLVSLLEAPELNPIDAPQAARERASLTLQRLSDAGKYPAEDILNAKTDELVFLPAHQTPEDDTAFIQYAVDQLQQSIDIRQLERGGLKVITTLDAGLQQRLECTVETRIQQIQAGDADSLPRGCDGMTLPPLSPKEEGISTTPQPSVDAGSLVMDPLTSEILAWSGVAASGNEVFRSDYKAGSLLMPLAAAAVFAGGMSPSTLVWDVPENDQSISLNPDGTWQGPVSLREAVLNGYTGAINQAAERTGADEVWAMFKAMGLTSLDQESLASLMAGGEGRTSLTGIAQAYSTLASLGRQSGIPDETGMQLSPLAVLRVEDGAGSVLYNHENIETRPVLDSALAYLVNDVLKGAVSREDTASPADGQPFLITADNPAAAAAGSADGGLQVWAAGYTPQRLAVVWMGAAQNSAENGRQKLSIDLPAGILQAVIRYTSKEGAVPDWQKPSGVTRLQVCHPSGLLPTSACPDVEDEIFISGNQPLIYDPFYQTTAVNRESGNLATVFTLPELVKLQSFFVVPEEYRDWAVAHGIPQPPADYDPLPEIPPLAGAQILSPASLAYVSGEIEITGTATGAGFTAYRLDYGEGLYPQSWQQIGEERTEPVKNGRLGGWDTGSLNGFHVIRLTVRRSQAAPEIAYLPVAVDNVPPTAAITWPLPGEVISYEPDKKVIFLADASDETRLDHLTWVVDGIAAGGSSREPFFLPWLLAPGRHTLYAEAYDQAGNTSQSAEIEIVVQ